MLNDKWFGGLGDRVRDGGLRNEGMKGGGRVKDWTYGSLSMR